MGGCSRGGVESGGRGGWGWSRGVELEGLGSLE